MRKTILAPFLVVGVVLLVAATLWFGLSSGGESEGEEQVAILLPPDEVVVKPLSYTQYDGRCPRPLLLRGASYYQLQPTQNFEQRLLDIFQTYDPPVRLLSGLTVQVLRIEDVCIFEYGGLIFGEPGSYAKLSRWFSERGIDEQNACEIIWVQCSSDFTPER